MQSTGIKTTVTEYPAGPNDRGSFTTAGYAILTEVGPNQKFTSVRKSYAPIAYGSKTFTPLQMKKSIYAKELFS